MREGGREGGKKGRREGGSEGGREGERAGEPTTIIIAPRTTQLHSSTHWRFAFCSCICCNNLAQSGLEHVGLN